ncbi:LacI family transcriptional regulator [Schaedlerella arabinosiphila]|jgi:DNA-binding LacI/PurR family transcriptional regulator|uniref:LacI family transcriptional regulator n=1 Tax=Schaedlerella arabinosiphila TaxID=2044587 RepID=A0A426DLG7_9FIRM|nr:LacI family DNA-binding transcriptional regulator [Schaedlerella arabinosiphila]RRK33602.1 LacI family transcriptional regulator [Schaedlerella arabinosiphila]
MKITRNDVAKRAGVSNATVSYVLNGSGKIKEETAKRVWKAVKELDYHPDMIARSMSKNETMQLGIVSEDVANPFFGEIVKGFESAANNQNYFVNICTGIHKLDEYFDNFITRRIDGIFLTALPHKYSNEKLFKLVEHGVRVVVSGNVNVDYRRIASIENDHLEAMRDAMEYLFGLGHRHIAYLNGLGKEMSNDLRYVGYKKMVENLELPCGYDLLINGKYPYATGVTEGYEEAKKLMQLGNKFTAVICTNDMMAFGAMKALQENGLRIPQDVSVMGFDGIDLGQYWHPSLTTMATDKNAFGKKAFELLYASIKDETIGYYKNKLKLIERDSTGICR